GEGYNIMKEYTGESFAITMNSFLLSGPDENVESLPCVFPFVFKNQVYTGCTTNGRSDGRYWCATSSNYNIDKMWRFCSEESDPTCVFPFIYKDKLYTTCTADGMRNGRCWCATTSNYDVDKKWTYCNITGRTEAVAVAKYYYC
uniref:Fibronectin type-II domain-containing protein n=1 Tax=Pseudonaja textilis TaxID=8673 RepID=A0A670ZKI5_PSETE